MAMMRRSSHRISRLLFGFIAIFLLLFYFFPVFNTTAVGDGHRPVANAIKHHANETAEEYDFIIVGGGQSGLVVANRLSESGEYTVLVVEYGHLYHDDPLIARPWRPFDAAAGEFHDPKLMYNYTSVPQRALNDRSTPVPAGATVGGGSTVNGMFLNRGSREDYDAWEELGNPGWGFAGLLPYFKRSVTFTPPGKWLQQEYGATFDEEAAYGENGPIHASNPAWAWPGQKTQIAGWKELGIKQSKEGAGGDAYGVFWVPRAQDPRTQTRSYSVTGHLDSAMTRPNFEMLTGHRVRNILLDENNAAYAALIMSRDGGGGTVIRARKEVVLAAGLHSPLILQRSGIGPCDMLGEAAVPCRVDLPGVGMNMQDHPAAGIAFDYMTNMPLNPTNLTDNTEYAAEMQAEFATFRTGPLAGGHNAVAFLTASDISHPSRFLEMLESQSKSNESTLEHLPAAYADFPELLAGFIQQRELLQRALASRKSAQIELPIAGDSYALHILQKPLARGSISLNRTNPMNGGPVVDFQTLKNPIDMEMMVDAMKFTRVWADTKAMSVLSPVERWPMTAVAADEEAAAAELKAQQEIERERKLIEKQKEEIFESAMGEEVRSRKGSIIDLRPRGDDEGPEPAYQEGFNEESANEDSTKSELLEEAPEDALDEALIGEERISEEFMNKESIQEEPVHEEPVNEEPVHEEIVEAEPINEGVESERLRIHIRNNAESSIGHESGTCAMMPLELGGVVASDLLVYGVGRLSVVDSSIIPLIPSTNLCATVYAVAEKAADLIKMRHSMNGDQRSSATESRT